MLESDPELNRKFREWSESRERHLWALAKRKPDAIAQTWQKEYLRTAKNKKSMARPFANEKPWIHPEGTDGNGNGGI